MGYCNQKHLKLNSHLFLINKSSVSRTAYLPLKTPKIFVVAPLRSQIGIMGRGGGNITVIEYRPLYLNYLTILFGGPLDFFKQQSCLFSIYIDSICQITITSISLTRLDYSYQTGNKISPSLHIILKIFHLLSLR